MDSSPFRPKNSFSVEVLKKVWGLIDPFLIFEPKWFSRLGKIEDRITRYVAAAHFITWPLIFILFFLINDGQKEPQWLWFKYRFGVATTIAALGSMSLLFKKSILVSKVALFLVGTVISMSIAWSHTLGYPIQSKWHILFPTLIYSTSFSSPLLSVALLASNILVTEFFWPNAKPLAWLTSDIIVAGSFIGLAFAARIAWITGKISEFTLQNLLVQQVEQKQFYDRQIKSFISPSIISRLDKMLASGANLAVAIDSVLKIRKQKIAVLFSDLRNYSARSDDLEFIVKELIPAAAAIIDPAEENMGVARQIGDGILIYYCEDDPEESLLRAVKDAFRCTLLEQVRVKNHGRTHAERYFTVTFGEAYVGNIASVKHRETTVCGSPANLSARIDSLTKEASIKNILDDSPSILLSQQAVTIFKSFCPEMDFTIVDLQRLNITIKSYKNETTLGLVSVHSTNLALLNRLLAVNSLEPIDKRHYDIW